MAEVAPAPAAAPAKAAKKKVSRPKKTGPSVSELIVKAVAASKERRGVSIYTVKKALTAGGYDVEKNKSRVKTAIKNLVTRGTLVQTKGIGASGSFKISKKAGEKPAKKAAPKAKKKPAAAKTFVTGVALLIVKVVAAFKKRKAVSYVVVKEALAARGYDVKKKDMYIRNAFYSLVTKGILVQTKGIGVGGSFKMGKMADKKRAQKAASKAKKKLSKRTKSSVNGIAELIVKVVAAFKEQKAVSYVAVKKALAARGYDVKKKDKYIRNAFYSLVTERILVQTKGIGLSGSFKMGNRL